MHKLIYVTDKDSGYSRVKEGGAFVYIDEEARKIEDDAVLNRIRNLVIPPAWREVWICKNDHGYLQATGLDAKGRKQYLYHPEWQRYRNETKFHKIIEFAQCLPKIRNVVAKHLRKKRWPKEKVLALVIKVLDEAFIRIGNVIYKEQNDTFGLTTLRRKHLKYEKGQMVFHYKAKSGKYRKVSIKNNQLSRLIKQCSELSGHEVFRYIDERGKSHVLDSSDVNTYLKRVTGKDFSSKSFRTWAASNLAIEKLDEARLEVENSKRKTLTPTLVKHVAEKMGNTPSICRDYYIHPAIIYSIEEGTVDEYRRRYFKKSGGLKPVESVTLAIIEDYEKKFPVEEVVLEEAEFL